MDDAVEEAALEVPSGGLGRPLVTSQVQPVVDINEQPMLVDDDDDNNNNNNNDDAGFVGKGDAANELTRQLAWEGPSTHVGAGLQHAATPTQTYKSNLKQQNVMRLHTPPSMKFTAMMADAETDNDINQTVDDAAATGYSGGGGGGGGGSRVGADFQCDVPPFSKQQKHAENNVNNNNNNNNNNKSNSNNVAVAVAMEGDDNEDAENTTLPKTAANDVPSPHFVIGNVKLDEDDLQTTTNNGEVVVLEPGLRRDGWSEEEVQCFLLALHMFGKGDFSSIAKLVHTKDQSDVVGYYYMSFKHTLAYQRWKEDTTLWVQRGEHMLSGRRLPRLVTALAADLGTDVHDRVAALGEEYSSGRLSVEEVVLAWADAVGRTRLINTLNFFGGNNGSNSRDTGSQPSQQPPAPPAKENVAPDASGHLSRSQSFPLMTQKRKRREPLRNIYNNAIAQNSSKLPRSASGEASNQESRLPRKITDGKGKMERHRPPPIGTPITSDDDALGSARTCTECGTASTPCWRRCKVTQAKLCNACGMRQQLKMKMGQPPPEPSEDAPTAIAEEEDEGDVDVDEMDAAEEEEHANEKEHDAAPLAPPPTAETPLVTPAPERRRRSSIREIFVTPAADISPRLAETPGAHVERESDNDGQYRCENCGTDSTPCWRRCRETSKVLCNACGIYQKTHHKARPVSLMTSRNAGLSGASACASAGAAATKMAADIKSDPLWEMLLEAAAAAERQDLEALGRSTSMPASMAPPPPPPPHAKFCSPELVAALYDTAPPPPPSDIPPPSAEIPPPPPSAIPPPPPSAMPQESHLPPPPPPPSAIPPPPPPPPRALVL
ncbi:GATA-type transcription factor sreA [Pycnococcus provasolii]